MWRLVFHTERRDTGDRATGHPGRLTELLHTMMPLDRHTPHRQPISSESRSTDPLMRQNMYRGRPPRYLTTVVVGASSISAMVGGGTATEASLRGGKGRLKQEPSEPCQGLLPRRRVNRAAHSLMPPLRLMNWSSGSAFGLYTATYRITRDHLLRVLLSALAGSDEPMHEARMRKIGSTGQEWLQYYSFETVLASNFRHRPILAST
jgi:hypothetical protein